MFHGRDVVDITCNEYGSILCDFLINSNVAFLMVGTTLRMIIHVLGHRVVLW